eukprot:209161_1
MDETVPLHIQSQQKVPSYQYKANGPLKHLLPEFHYDFGGVFGWTAHNSYFVSHGMYFDELQKDSNRDIDVEHFVQYHWSKSYNSKTISMTLDDSYSPQAETQIKDEYITSTKYTLIKNINYPTAQTLEDISKLMTTTKSTALSENDERLTFGYVRSIGADSMKHYRNICEICLLYLNDNQKNILQPIGKAWKWGYKVQTCGASNAIHLDMDHVQNEIYLALINAIKDQGTAWKCICYRGIVQYERYDITQEWDTIDIWWLLDQNTSDDKEVRANCVFIRFIRMFYLNDK